MPCPEVQVNGISGSIEHSPQQTSATRHSEDAPGPEARRPGSAVDMAVDSSIALPFVGAPRAAASAALTAVPEREPSGSHTTRVEATSIVACSMVAPSCW